MNQEFLARMNGSARIHLTPARVKGKYVIRFVANQENCSEDQVESAWELIKEFAVEVLDELAAKKAKPAGGAQKWKKTLNYLKGDIKNWETLSFSLNILLTALRKFDNTHSQRFSFTRCVSQEVFDRQCNM